MPLIKGKSKDAFSKNVRTEMDAHPSDPKRDLAIAYAVKRHANAKKKAFGGVLASPQNQDQMQGGSGPHGKYADGGSVGKKIGYPVGASMANGGMAMGNAARNMYADGGVAAQMAHDQQGRVTQQDMNAINQLMPQPKARGGMAEDNTTHLNGGYARGGRARRMSSGGIMDEDHESHLMNGYAEGGEIPEEDEARGHDPIPDGHYDLENEDLNPTNEPEHGSARMMKSQHDFGFREQNYEYPPPPYEKLGSVHVDDENLPAHMFAHGGLAHAIMQKHMRMCNGGRMAFGGGISSGDRFKTDRAHEESDHVYAEGGIVPDEGGDEGGIFAGDRFKRKPEHEEEDDAYAFGGGISSGDRFKTDRAHEESDHVYARGGRIELDESIDNQYPDDHPDNDYLSDEEQTPYFNYTDADTFDPNEKRRKFISRSMRKANGMGGANTTEVG